jgi:hypothetical protein
MRGQKGRLFISVNSNGLDIRITTPRDSHTKRILQLMLQKGDGKLSLYREHTVLTTFSHGMRLTNAGGGKQMIAEIKGE